MASLLKLEGGFFYARKGEKQDSDGHDGRRQKEMNKMRYLRPHF